MLGTENTGFGLCHPLLTLSLWELYRESQAWCLRIQDGPSYSQAVGETAKHEEGCPSAEVIVSPRALTLEPGQCPCLGAGCLPGLLLGVDHVTRLPEGHRQRPRPHSALQQCPLSSSISLLPIFGTFFLKSLVDTPRGWGWLWVAPVSLLD